MLTDITRYDPIDYSGLSALMEEHVEGGYVDYIDHKAIVRDMQEQIWELKDRLEAVQMEAGGYA